MIFNTWTFACFAAFAVTFYWTLVPQRFRAWYLVLVGCVFYAWAVPAYLILIAFLAIVTYLAGHALLSPSREARQRRAILTAAIVVVAGALVVFKYTKFLAATVDDIARHNILPIPAIVVPLAISFFTFEFVHVLVDIYQRKITSLRVRDFAVFTMFFPTLVAGPIKRYESFVPQLDALASPDSAHLALNLYRIAIGVVKKMVIADSMSVLTQPILTPGFPYGRLDYWVAMLAYSAKIYFDFSGYSDIAIGVAGVLGLRIPENFDRPYWSQNIQVFWRRWHMSLSTWIRDYIFIPLGGSRGKSPLVTAVNLFIAMAIAGLWHGAAFTFVCWGLWHGLGLAANRAWGLSVVPRVTFLAKPSLTMTSISTLGTFLFVAVGWVLFAATSLSSAAAVYGGMFVLGGRQF